MPDLSVVLALAGAGEDEFLLRVVDVEGRLARRARGAGFRRVRPRRRPSGRGPGLSEEAARGVGARVTALAFAIRATRPPCARAFPSCRSGRPTSSSCRGRSWPRRAGVHRRSGAPTAAGWASAARHDYGRDDVWCLWPHLRVRQVDWSHRRGPFLMAGFRVRVIHCLVDLRHRFEQCPRLARRQASVLGLEAGRSDEAPPALEYQVAVLTTAPRRVRPEGWRAL